MIFIGFCLKIIVFERFFSIWSSQKLIKILSTNLKHESYHFEKWFYFQIYILLNFLEMQSNIFVLQQELLLRYEKPLETIVGSLL